MNPETKEFIDVKEADIKGVDTENWPKFSIGQEVKIGNTSFKIRKITKKDIVIRPVK